MMPREFATAACRLLALYCGLRALQALAALPALSWAPLSAWPVLLQLLPLLLWAAAATLLWWQAPRIARRLDPQPARSRIGAAESLLCQLAGCLLLIDAVATLAGRLLQALLPGGMRLALDAATLLPLTVGLLQLAGGAALLFAAPALARRHVARLPAPPSLDTRLPRALGEMIGSVGVTGLNKLTELALTLKNEAEGRAIQVMRSSMDTVIAAVQGRRPDFSASASPDGTVTIAFSDMEGFTAMTERLGDRRAHRLIKLHNDMVRSELRRHGGQEVELQGDGFLLAFGDAAAALRCSCAIQKAFARFSARHPQEPLRVRIGLHTGKPIKEGDRFFGLSVILAARIAAQARGGEILVSAALRERFAGSDEFAFDAGREAELKGLAGTHRMHSLLWEQISTG